ncbi:nuclear speckle splicing regulatory protein 1 isoform X1 [Festucalex cinctus]
MAVPAKQYGLILPQKKSLTKPTHLQKLSVFGDDSDDEATVGESLQKEAAKKKTMRQTQLEMRKALEEDSTVYDYDAVYDDIQKQRLDNSKKVLSGAERKPKYIHQLMKAVDSRKKEQERREERKIQKEREAEGSQFADKEAYVTSAYKRKLQEQKEEEERERREAAIEAALDVRKQKDLSGFYRHLLNQTVGEEAIPDRSANKSQKSEDGSFPETSQTSRDVTTSPGSDGEDAREEKHGFRNTSSSSSQSKRHYRRRSASSGSDGEERDARRKKEREKDKSRGGRRDRDGDGQSHRSRHQDRARERDGKRKPDKDKEEDKADRKETTGEEKVDREETGQVTKDESKENSQATKDEGEENSQATKNEGEENSQATKNEGEENSQATKNEGEENSQATKNEGEENGQATKDEGEENGQAIKDEGQTKVNKFAKRSNEQTLSSARDRYLARQMARSASKSYIVREED